jgi:peptidoglycan/xylan/chitin deacetylase (PgdA/CDA1 family)
MARHLVCLTFDFDTVALWMAERQTTPTPISRGEFGVVGAHRLLALLDRFDIRTTWFVPGVTADTYPDDCRAIAAAGHEIGHHGYDHISPAQLTPAEERDQLRRGVDAIVRLGCPAPRGYRSPAWDLSAASVELLLEEGFVYDSSMMGHDYLPYAARTGDHVVSGEPVVFGPASALVELPVSWSLDDFPHFESYRGHGLRPTSGVLEAWCADFEYLAREYAWGVMTVTCHPFVIGRGHRMLMLEQFLESLAGRATFVTAAEAVAEHLARRATDG